MTRGILTSVECVRCRRTLQEIESEGETIDFCTRCRGAWVDAKELDAFTDQPEALRVALARGLQDEKPAAFRCPRCGGAMREGYLFDPAYRLEHCEACRGVWFDSRELSQLRRVRAPSPTPPPGGPERSALQKVAENTSPTRASRSRPSRESRLSRTRESPQLGRPQAETGPRCPSCHKPPKLDDIWQCACGHRWRLFSTYATCPRCRTHWEYTKCLRCYAWSPVARWFE